MNRPVAVVAGAGPGLGRALAQRFIQGGMRVAVLAREASRLNANCRVHMGIEITWAPKNLRRNLIFLG